MMKLAKKDSNRLSGIAKINIPAGSTFIFRVCAQHEHGHTLLEALIKIAKLQI
jgi:hypothetical protein